MKVQRCKGTQDLSPGRMKAFRLIEGVFRDGCLQRGYEEVRTPTLEYLHLFTSTGTLTPSRLRKVYSFLDWDGWSGERVVLRPDGTIPIARLYIESMAEQKLAKLFYVTNVFSFEETGKEAREKWQCGAELIGAGSTVADVELMVLALNVLKKLGLEDVELRLSHADLIRALLGRLGLSSGEQAKVFDQILDGDAAVLAKAKAERPELAGVLTLLLDRQGKSAGFLKNIKALFPRDLQELKPALDNFIRKLSAKITKHRDEIVRVDDRTEDADIAIVSYGSVYRAARAASMFAREMGMRVGTFRPVTLWPLMEMVMAGALNKKKPMEARATTIRRISSHHFL